MTVLVNVIFITDIYQNFVYLIETSMRRDNIGIKIHSSPNRFDSYNNSNTLNAKTIIKDIDRISDIYELFWNALKHSGFTYLSDDSNNSNKFYLCELDINGLLSMNEEKNNFDESVKQALGYYESEEGKQWFEHSNNDDITDPSSYIRQFNYGDANAPPHSHRYRRITCDIGGIGGDGIALIGEKAAMAAAKGCIFGIDGSIGNGTQTIDEKMKINIHELMLDDNMSTSNDVKKIVKCVTTTKFC